MATDHHEINEDSQEENTVLTRSNFSNVSQKNRHPMETLLKSGASSIMPPKRGEVVEGRVITKKGTRLFTDLGIRGVGVIFGKEFHAAHEIIKNLQPGDTISAKVVETDNEEGYIELSLKEAGDEKRWIDLKEKMKVGTTLELPVVEANRGGLLLEANGIRGFLPTSQLSAKHYPRVEGGEKEKILQELQQLVNTTLNVKILDVDAKENKLIFTEKSQDSEALQLALAKYKKGDEVEGEITGVVDFGAFMKFDEVGIEGLIHISEIDWSLIEDPRNVLTPGDRIKAKIIDIQGDKVSLSLKALKEDPWIKVAEKYKKGDLVHGKVTKFNPFGAFVELEAAIQGLVHISEFGTEIKMKEALELDKTYDFKILLVDPQEHRMALGIIKEGANETEETKKNETPSTDEK